MKRHPASMRAILIGGLVALTTWATAPAAFGVDTRALPGAFDIKKAPSQADWQAFLKAPAAIRRDLWKSHRQRGVMLGAWSWGWRLGWVRACAEGRAEPCPEVLRQALGDKAVVVRAEAATRLGRIYEDSGNAAIVEMLGAAFKNPRNMRAGQPLFVQSRILFALSRIGGDKARSTAAELAKTHPHTAQYWGKLERAERGASEGDAAPVRKG